MLDFLHHMRFAVAAGALHVILSACQPTSEADLAAMQSEVAQAMGITFYLPAPSVVATYDLSTDGRTLARTKCWTDAKVVMSIEYAAGVDWARNKATIAHELHHAIQCHSGRMAELTEAESEREADAVERWWIANHH